MSVDFIVLTGFLGSGKTTLLRDFLAAPGSADTAVIVNEVGEIGLDGAILREAGPGEVAMALLSNGCVCCAMGSDLAFTVETLLNGPRLFRRVVLETSGLSKPGPVLRQLAQLARYRLRVGVVATWDAERAAAAAGFAEALAQWAGADTIVATKTDRIAAISEQIAGFSPFARCIMSADRADAVRQAFTLGPASPPAVISELVAHPRISVLLARTPGPVAYDDLACWLDNLAGLAGDRLLRLKGLVRVTESPRPLLVQSVGTTFAAPRPFADAGQDSFMVIIGRDLDWQEIASVTPDLGLTVSAGGRDRWSRPARTTPVSWPALAAGDAG